MVSHITQRYMRKYATNDDQQAVSAKIQDLIEKNAKTDIYKLMKDIEHRIALELFNIKRVVDDGNFHLQLESNKVQKLNLVHDIPVCCKVALDG